MAQSLIFYDDASGTPLYRAALPEGFSARAELREVKGSDSVSIKTICMAGNAENNVQLFFETGDSYTTEHQSGSQSNYHPFCSAAEQLTELACAFTGQRAAPVNQFALPDPLLRKVQEEGEQEIARLLNTLKEISSMFQYQMPMQCTGKILDGAMGIYPFQRDGQEWTLYNCITRVGLTLVTGVSGPLRNTVFAREKGHTTWSIPMVTNLVAPGPVNPDQMAVLIEFLNTLEKSPQLIQYVERINQESVNRMKGISAASIQNTQQTINALNASHEAAWARAEATSRSMSQDMDRFRQSQAENAASMNQFRSGFSSMNSGSFGDSSRSGFESLDDRVQRMRHESIMGVNTYEREDGTTYEHTIMDDRVFEHQADSNSHFGTQDYHGDYVPDNWYEMNRKK